MLEGKITYREIEVADFEAVMKVRLAVKENRLLNVDAVTKQAYEDMICRLGKGWVCEADGQIVGFSIINIDDGSVWALFLLPEYEGKGIGNELHRLMVDWAFEHGKTTLSLGTDPKTRAESFYYARGWKKIGDFENGEVHLVLSLTDWKN